MKPFKRSIYILGHYPYLYLLMLPSVIISIISFLLTMNIYGNVGPILSMISSTMSSATTLIVSLIFIPALGQHLIDIVTVGPQPHFFARGVQRHWFKPLCLGLLIVAAVLIALLPLGLITLTGFIISGFALTHVSIIIMIISSLLILLLSIYLGMVRAIIFPILFEREIRFFDAIKLGLRLVFNHLGRLLMYSLILLIINVSFGFGITAIYMLVNHIAFTNFTYAMSELSLVYLFITPLNQFIVLWSYAYIFSFWATIRDKVLASFRYENAQRLSK